MTDQPAEDVRTLLGVETEYALTGFARDGETSCRDVLVMSLMRAARRALVFLPGASDFDLFLENGSRLYLDTGSHPELATPECSDPLDVVRYVLAGESIMDEVARKIERRHAPDVERVSLFKSNVDYSGAGTSWGCHESYLYRAAPSRLPSAILPHLVSRVVLTGAGGFRPDVPGIEFTLSPRVWHLTRAESSSSTHHRGIFHSKQESLAASGYRRLHVLSGESLCSERAMWLKLATTSLLVLLVDAGDAPGDALELAQPLAAMQVFASDPTVRRTVRLSDGRWISAIQIQRRLLEAVESRLAHGVFPQWAERACAEWRESLALLEKSPKWMSGRLDWAIKRRFYDRWIATRDFTWDRLERWSAIVAELSDDTEGSLCAEDVIERRGRFREAVDAVEDSGALRGLDWEELAPFLSLRSELFELDLRFAELGERSLFRVLDEANELDHRVAGLGDVAARRSIPPDRGRARLRGELVKRLARQRTKYRCYWDGIWDVGRGRVVSLRHPFHNEDRWQPAGRPRARGLPIPEAPD